jgi:glutamate dehydrogenase
MSKINYKSFKSDLTKIAKSRGHINVPDHVLSQALDIAQSKMDKRKKNENLITITPSSKRDNDDKHDQTLVVILTKDRPFLIDSITAECVANKHTIEGVLHTTIGVERTKAGTLQTLEVKPSKEAEIVRESLLIITLSGFYGEVRAKELCKKFDSIITDVEFATTDWQAMREALKETVNELENTKKAKDKELFTEYEAFLNYLYDNNFTLLGYREYKLTSKGKVAQSKIVKGSGLGLLSDEKQPVYINKTRQNLSEDLQKLRMNQATLTVAKVNKRSTVHRRVPMDAIAIKTYDSKGNVTGERLFIGLFTSVTYSRSIQDVPYLRQKVNNVVEKSGFSFNSHNYRALMHILEKYPRDELFQINSETLKDFALSIMTLQEQPKVALYVRPDPFKRYISCLVYVPREKYETDLRIKVQQILETRLDGHGDAFYTVLDDSPLARVIYTIRVDETTNKKYDFKKIEQELIEAGRSWDERIEQSLIDHCHTEVEALHLTKKYKGAFSVAYQAANDMESAMADIEKLEDVQNTKSFSLDLYEHRDASQGELNLKIYNPDAPVTLSDILPILDNFGFDAIEEKPFEVKLDDQKIWIHDFLIRFKNIDQAKKSKDIKDVFEAGLTAIWNKKCEDDDLNALIPLANMPWRDVLILRTYTKYMRQTKIQYTPQYMMKALTDHPEISDLFIEIFYGMHKPAHSRNKSKTIVDDNTKKIEKQLQNVSSYDQDRILRSLLQIIQSTLRTNFFQTDKDGDDKQYVSVKIDSQHIDIIPLPKPMVEIFVYSPRVEGVHLRGGKIARGGIRWSDRHEDFRTEILGLMKAQNVKNAVIIPVGSKGGFIVKNPPATNDRKAQQDEGIACYKIFMRGLLDITDNVVKDKIVPPKNVVRHDKDDPYLVVAADKGTASFSDIANGLSEDYDFWLGDAFASGGSAGYDHKAMGITARGAWESVKRHFRELGKNIQEEEFDVMGVGDMGGDVFGNGMLLSEKIRLVAAFNHMHIFVDPTPNPETSFKERTRLFKDAKGWDDYNESYLSKGGKIYSRHDKILKLTPEIQKRLDIDKKEVSPLELMHAILKAETDLFWFGGIGTYIKAPNEAHSDVGDKANDNIRIDAHEVRAKVIGEGANLGVTHSARICMALLGVKLYADFIDNSGGVNSSDLEVNIKILFQKIMQDTSMTVKQRNKILSKMTDDVANLVLRNNYQQTQAISMTAHKAADKLSSHASLIEHLENNFGLNREVENLPSESAIENRSRDKQGLTTPELSTLISYTKIKLFQDLVDSDLPDDDSFQEWMNHYFPSLLRKKYNDDMDHHRLRREIIATQLANSIVNRMGPTFIMNQTRKTGADAGMIARVYFIVREAFDLRDLYEDIEQLDNKIDAKAQIEAFDEVASFIDYATTWFLQYFRENGDSDKTIIKTGEHYDKAIDKLLKSFDSSLPDSTKNFINTEQKRLSDKGFPAKTAKKLSLLPVLNTTCDIIRISDEQEHDLSTVARVYFELNATFSFVWLRDKARNMEPASRWESETLHGLIDRLYGTQAALTKRIVVELCSDKKCPISPVQDWLKKGNGNIDAVVDTINHLQDINQIDFAMLTSIEMRLGQLR